MELGILGYFQQQVVLVARHKIYFKKMYTVEYEKYQVHEFSIYL